MHGFITLIAEQTIAGDGLFVLLVRFLSKKDTREQVGSERRKSRS